MNYNGYMLSKIEWIEKEAEAVISTADNSQPCHHAHEILRACQALMPTESRKYNGWTNRATWACALWMGECEDRVLEIIEEEKITEFTENEAARIVEITFLDGIPDLDDCIPPDDSTTAEQTWETYTHYNPIYANLHGDIDFKAIAEYLKESVEDEETKS